ncbi:MAG TPA: Asp-tRNA(Asn)/Glu-tRNA(Gln) amidotransferase subunit GatA [Microbacteriaceae bacterium]|nr:Asp-tRNA(Asn)/Glu-tRNA(Gln) amidotransferase subunit GatA [Microbacteriaceae bacterium]
MSEIFELTAAELSEKLEAKELSAVEVTKAHLERIANVDQQVHAFLTLNEEALATAEAIDKARAEGSHAGVLAGVPIAVKDVLVTQGMPTTAGSKILEGYMSPFDATVVEKIKKANLVQLGKTNMDEFAMGATTETSAFGNTYNPWNLKTVPGGSGGGSAAALAAFETPLALGSDTGGSIRQPAALTGTVGMKPTYGGVSRYGSIALASSLDQIGPAARTVLDTALLHDLIAGYDPRDGVSINTQWPSMADAARAGSTGASLDGLRVGVIKQLDSNEIQNGVKSRFEETVAWLTKNGAEVIEVEMPSIELAVQAYYVILAAEASSNLSKFDSVRFGLRVTPENTTSFEDVMSATRGAGFGAEVKRRILLGIHVLSKGQYDTIFTGAQKVRTLVINEFQKAFEEVDIIASLTGPETAWNIEQSSDNPMRNYLKDGATIPANLAGLPALSLPIGLADEDQMPVGLQLLGAAKNDDLLYKTGAALEQMVIDRDGSAVWRRVPTTLEETR